MKLEKGIFIKKIWESFVFGYSVKRSLDDESEKEGVATRFTLTRGLSVAHRSYEQPSSTLFRYNPRLGTPALVLSLDRALS